MIEHGIMLFIRMMILRPVRKNIRIKSKIYLVTFAVYANPKGIHIVLIHIVWSVNIMTLNGAIKYCEEVAEKNKKTL